MQFSAGRSRNTCAVLQTFVRPFQIERLTMFSLESLSTHDFETRTASGNELFSLITRLHTITFTMLSTFLDYG